MSRHRFWSSDLKTSLPHKHYTALDGLRGLAILLVFGRHSLLTTHLHSRAVGVLAWFGKGGWLGVDLFFVLSGFLITGILIGSLNKPQYFKNFYIRRSLRIFPLFYGVLLLCWLLTPVLHLKWEIGHLSYLFYCQNIAADFNSALMSVPPALNLEHFWSLAVEEQFYMLWPLTIFLLREPRKILRFSLSLVGVALILRCVLIFDNSSHWIYKELPTHADGLLIGAALASALRIQTMDQILGWMRWPTYISAMAAISIVAVTRSLDFNNDWMSSLGFTVTAVLFGALLLQCLRVGSPACRIFSRKELRFFGKYSYGIYVYHLLFSPLFSRILYFLQGGLHSRMLGSIAYLGLWFASSIAVAVLSYKFFESYFLRLKDRLAPPSGSSATGSMASLDAGCLLSETAPQ